jgi:hypothetical protein
MECSSSDIKPDDRSAPIVVELVRAISAAAVVELTSDCRGSRNRQRLHVVGVRLAAPKDTENRLHQMATLSSLSRFVPAGTAYL